MAYIGTSPSQGVRHRYLFTATSGQTTFTGSDDDSRTLSYTDTKFMDVFLNGVLLDPNSDYTATTGSSVVLTSGASTGDLLEVIAFDTFSVFSGTFGGDVTVGGALDATTATFDRAGTDGTIIDLQKDGSTVGSIGSYVGFPTIGKTDTGLLFQDGANSVHPWNIDTNSASDGIVDLGTSNNRFKDLYLSGGVYLGGTGSANYLDDYEEGTWTPTYAMTGSAATITHDVQVGHYRKIGATVWIWGRIYTNGWSGGSGNVAVNGLPFTSQNTSNLFGVVNFSYINNFNTGGAPAFAYIGANENRFRLISRNGTAADNDASQSLFTSDMFSGAGGNDIIFAGSYLT